MLDIKTIIDYFADMDQYLERKIDICILGGCFFVLRRLKPASPDLDIIVEGKDYTPVLKIVDILKKKYKFSVDILTDRWLENIQLPRNYMKRARRYRRYRRRFSHIRLWTLSIYDIIISKIYRWEKKDVDDVNILVSHYRVFRHKLERRINKCHILNKRHFDKNLDEFYRLFGSKLKEKVWF